jgi:hypothetical protein
MRTRIRFISHLFFLCQASRFCTSIQKREMKCKSSLLLLHTLQQRKLNKCEGLRRGERNLEMALDVRYGKPLGAHEAKNALRCDLCN